MSDKINLWPFLPEYLEDEYLEETGLSPYVDEVSKIQTFEFVKHVVDANQDVIGELTEEEVREWYDANIKPMMEPKRAPEIAEMMPRVINVYFIKEYKFFFNKNNKKDPSDYVLNIDKVVEEKMGGAPPIVFNNVQTFMLNYEIKKLLDKAITIVNEKYDNVIYINGSMSTNGVLNIIGHLEKTYKEYSFNYVLLDKESEFADILERCNKVNIVKTLF